MNVRLHLLFGILLSCLFSCQTAKQMPKAPYLRTALSSEEISKTYNNFQRLCHQTTGHFSAKARSTTAGRDSLSLEVVGIPIFSDHHKVNEFWVYNEFFLSGMESHPITQQVYAIYQIRRDSIHIHTYLLNNPEQYLNEWKKNRPFEDLKKSDLIFLEDCQYAISVKTPGKYQTLAAETKYPLGQSFGADYGRYQIEYRDNGILLHTILFDKNHQVVPQMIDENVFYIRTNDPKYAQKSTP